MAKQAKGWLRRRMYADGEVWLFCYYVRARFRSLPKTLS